MLCFFQTLEHHWRTYKETKKDKKTKRAYPRIHGFEAPLSYLTPYVAVGNSNANILVLSFVDTMAEPSGGTHQNDFLTSVTDLNSTTASQQDNNQDDPPPYGQPTTADELPAYVDDLPPIYDDFDERRRPTVLVTLLRRRYQVKVPGRMSSLSQRYGYGPTASEFLGLDQPRVDSVVWCMRTATGVACGHASCNRDVFFPAF